MPSETVLRQSQGVSFIISKRLRTRVYIFREATIGHSSNDWSRKFNNFIILLFKYFTFY